MLKAFQLFTLEGCIEKSDLFHALEIVKGLSKLRGVFRNLIQMVINKLIRRLNNYRGSAWKSRVRNKSLAVRLVNDMNKLTEKAAR